MFTVGEFFISSKNSRTSAKKIEKHIFTEWTKTTHNDMYVSLLTSKTDPYVSRKAYVILYHSNNNDNRTVTWLWQVQNLSTKSHKNGILKISPTERSCLISLQPLYSWLLIHFLPTHFPRSPWKGAFYRCQFAVWLYELIILLWQVNKVN